MKPSPHRPALISNRVPGSGTETTEMLAFEGEFDS
jgi:hypothetical protein